MNFARRRVEQVRETVTEHAVVLAVVKGHALDGAVVDRKFEAEFLASERDRRRGDLDAGHRHAALDEGPRVTPVTDARDQDLTGT